MLKSPNKFLEPCYLPEGVLLTEISKMKGGPLNACIRHWSGRVHKGEIAFRFKAVEDSHLREVNATKKRHAPHDKAKAKSSHREKLADSQDGDQMSADESDQESADENEVTGKGKAKAVVELWYGGFTYGSS
jgi:hypothetical protein